MALDFPANPSNGQVFESYIWSSVKGAWQAREESASPATISPVPPTSPASGDIWVDSSDGVSYVYYNDGSSSQWIELVSSGVPQMTSKANLSGGNSFTGTQTFATPISVSSGGTGLASLTSGGYLKGNGASNIVSQSGIPAGDITSGNLDIARGGTGVSNGAGLVPIVPTSITGTGGSSSFDSTTGVVTLVNAGQWQLNGVFNSTYKNYRIIMRGSCDADRGFGWRFTSGGTVNSNAFYHWSMFWNGGSGMGTNAAQSATFIGYSLGHRYISMVGDVMSPALTGYVHHMNFSYSGLNSATTGNELHCVQGILRDVNYSADGIFGFVSAGTFTGTIQILGYRG